MLGQFSGSSVFCHVSSRSLLNTQPLPTMHPVLFQFISLRASQVAGADGPGSTTITGPVSAQFPEEQMASPTSSCQSGLGSHLSLSGRFLNGVCTFIQQHFVEGVPILCFLFNAYLSCSGCIFYSLSRHSLNGSCSEKSSLSPHMPQGPWVRALLHPMSHTDFGWAGSQSLSGGSHIASPPSSAGLLTIVLCLFSFTFPAFSNTPHWDS